MKKLLIFLLFLACVSCVPAQTLPTNKTFTFTAGGGTKNIPLTSYIEYWTLSGNCTLSSSWTIQPSGTPAKGMVVKIIYNASVVLSGNYITIFGQSLSIYQAKESAFIICTYDTNWTVRIMPNFGQLSFITDSMLVAGTITGDRIAPQGVTHDNIKDGDVTIADKLGGLGNSQYIVGDIHNRPHERYMTGDASIDSNGKFTIGTHKIDSSYLKDGSVTPQKLSSQSFRQEVIPVTVSFESGEQMDTWIPFPYPCTVTKCIINITKTLSATDSGRVGFFNASSATDPGGVGLGFLTSLDLVSGFYRMPPGASISINPYHIITFAGNNIFAANSYLVIETIKPTVGGKLYLMFWVSRN